MKRLLRRIPWVQRWLYEEFQLGYRVGFNSRGVAEDIAKANKDLTIDEAAARIRKAMP